MENDPRVHFSRLKNTVQSIANICRRLRTMFGIRYGRNLMNVMVLLKVLNAKYRRQYEIFLTRENQMLQYNGTTSSIYAK